MPFLVFAVLLLSGCAAGSGGPACRPAGEWFLNSEVIEGDCLEVGREFYEFLRIEDDGDKYRAFWSDGSELGYVNYSSERCTLEFISVFYSPATPETYEATGNAIYNFEIVGDDITGTSHFSFKIWKDEGIVDCEQTDAITGGRL